MTTPFNPSDEKKAAVRGADNWAKTVDRLQVGDVPVGAINLNVAGRRLQSPIQGFGKMWQKTYRMHLPGRRVAPSELIKEWKANFGSFWPSGNKFYGPLTGVSPGDVALLNLKAGPGVKLSTGVLVMYADDESFTFMTPQGHQFAAWITFSAFEDQEGTVVQVQPLLRASDPLYEVAMPLMNRMEDKFWAQTLRNLAAHFAVDDVRIDRQVVCVDKRRQWRMARNVWHNAGIRSFFYTLNAPFRLIAKPFRRSGKTNETSSGAKS